MEKHLEISDDLFEQQFEACTFDPAIFSHEAHLRLAWIHVKKYGTETAVENVSIQLVSFVESLGAAEKYNKTVTIAAVKAVAHFMGRSGSDNFIDFIQEHPRLKYNFKDLMSAHYQIDIFKSQEAKQRYLEPDLLPFS